MEHVDPLAPTAPTAPNWCGPWQFSVLPQLDNEVCIYCHAPTVGTCSAPGCTVTVCAACTLRYEYCRVCLDDIVAVFERAKKAQPAPHGADKDMPGDPVFRDWWGDRGAECSDGLLQLISHRNRVGLKTYGVPLSTYNGRDFVADCLQELADAVMYLHGAQMERTLTPAEQLAIQDSLNYLQELLDQ